MEEDSHSSNPTKAKKKQGRGKKKTKSDENPAPEVRPGDEGGDRRAPQQHQQQQVKEPQMQGKGDSGGLEPEQHQGGGYSGRGPHQQQQSRGAWGRGRPQKQETRGPPQQQETRGPPQQQETREPPQQQETRGPPQQQKTREWSQKQETRGPPQQQETRGPPQQQKTRGPPQQQKTREWSQKQETRGPPQQQETRGPPQQQKTRGWPQQQETRGWSQQQETRGWPQQQETRGGPQQQETRGPPQQQETRGPPPQQETRGPPQQQKTRGPPQQQQSGGDQGREASQQPTASQQPQQRQESRESQQKGGSEVREQHHKQPQRGSKLPGQESIVCPRNFSSRYSGRPINVLTNFFPLKINPNIKVHHYDITFTPDKPKYLLRPVWNKFCSMMFPKRITAFDGSVNAFSNGPLLADKTCSATVTVLNPENNKEKEFKVEIQEVRIVDLSIFQNYREKMLKDTKLKVLPEEQITVLDVIMRNWASNNFISSGRHFFAKKERSSKAVELSDKLEMRHGYFQSVFLGWQPYLNFDISHKAFYQRRRLLDILGSFEHRHTHRIDIDEFNSFIRDVKVKYQLPNDPSSARLFRVNKLVESALKQKFEKDGASITVADYFAQEKKCRLTYPDLPLVWVGPRQKSIYLPLEFCEIVDDQVYKGLMDANETRMMVRNATSDARRRRGDLMYCFGKTDFGNMWMKEFGLSVSGEMARVPARVLDPPSLNNSRVIRVNEGVWRSRDFLEPMTLDKWCILNIDKYVDKQGLAIFQKLIQEKGNEFKMRVGNPTRNVLDGDSSPPGMKRAFSQLKDMRLVFVIIPDMKGVYSRVKTICETQEGILTQCIKSKTLKQDPRKMSTTVENILLKVNAKLGGKNHCLDQRDMPECLDGYVMIVGADVTHSGPGSRIPSVAAVAVSNDPKAFQYGISMRVQQGEIIKDLEEIMKDHLSEFKRTQKNYPEKIIFFRDGVSEGELEKVFHQELGAVKRACSGKCNPKITFVVVQKRHHTRFYPTRPEDEQGKNFNVPVGTCVDSEIVHPRDLDFYLVSHASILGTARPTRYRLVHDDNKLTDDHLERLSYYLCHLFSRCNRSVSYPSPTYYAHLAAFRARAYLEGLNLTIAQDLSDIQRKMEDKISAKSPMFFV